MVLVALDDIELRVMDIIQAEFKLTKEQYLETFEVNGRIDLDLEIDANLYNEIVESRTITKRLGLPSPQRVSSSHINIGFAGLSQEPRRRSIDDKEFLERDKDKENFTQIEGLTKTRVVKFESDLTNAELEDLAKSKDKYRLSHGYKTENPPLELIPIRFSGRFIRDYEDLYRSRGLDVEEEYLGKSSLRLVITNTTLERPVEIMELRISFAETFPRLLWSPRNFGRLIPERRELIFSGVRIEPEQSQSFDIIANLESLLQLGIIKGQLRAEIESFTVSGLNADWFFLSNGYPLISSSRATEHVTRVLANLELDPKAMEEELLKSQALVFHMDDVPRTVFDNVIRFFGALGYLLPAERECGEAKRHEIKSNTWRESHKIDGVRKVFNDAVVRINTNIDGEFGEITEEREFEVGGTLTEKGKKNTYGRTTVTVLAQSTNEARMNQCLEEITEFFVRKEK